MDKEAAKQKRLKALADGRAKAAANRAAAKAASRDESRVSAREDNSDRMDRDFEDRNYESHEPYRPPGTLPDVDPGQGYKMRWVRRTLAGSLDNINLHRAYQDGWRPMSLNDYPQYRVLANAGATDLEIGDLVAMRNTVERLKKRDKYYASLSRGKLEAIDKEYREMDNKTVRTVDERSRVWEEGRL